MKAIVHVLASLVLAAVLAACSVAGSTPSSLRGSSIPSELGPSPTSSHGDAHRHDLGLAVSVEPSCVAPGEDVTMTVLTVPRAPVIYLAHYADGSNGADEPFGDGYGGNDGGFADSSGRYEDTWTVAQDAPPGPVRIEVQAAAAGEQGDAETHFTLLRSGESCPPTGG